MQHISRPVLTAMFAFLLALTGLVWAGPPAEAGNALTVSVRVTRVAEVSCDEGDFVPCPDDYYASVNIAGAGFEDSAHVDNPSPPDIHPNWLFSRTVDSALVTVLVVIQIWDDEDSSANDLLDACNPGGTDIDLSLDLASGNWSGDTPNGVGFCEGDHVKVWFELTVVGNPDFDGDGIPDDVELAGLRNGGGAVVADLPALGADPCRPSIAVEIDYMAGAADGHTHRPLDAALAEARAAFDSSPEPVKPGCPYPGFPRKATGVDLISVVDDAVGEQANTEWGMGADAIRTANFDSELRPFFHYSLWIHQLTGSNAGSSGVCCSDSGKDPIVSLGGWTNDVGSVREQSGTYIHELGHALGFGHGGGDPANDINCKPNYLSIMSYAFQTTGIPDPTLPAANVDTNNDGTADARFRLDLSRQALDPLVETTLDENVGIRDGTDLTLWSHDGGASIRSAPGNGSINWDNDRTSAGAPLIEDSVSVDVSNLGIDGCGASPGQTLNGFDDWANIKYRAKLSPNAGYSPPPAPEVDVDTARQLRTKVAEAVQPDLALTLAGAPDPVLTGSTTTFTTTVRNLRGMPADDVTIGFTKPTGTTVTGCVASAGGTCSGSAASFDLIEGGATVKAAFTVSVACEIPDGTSLSATAAITAVASDADPSNDSATASVVASNPPPVITGLTASPDSLWPPNHKMREVTLSYTVTDNCGTPAVSVVVASNEPENGLGDGDVSPDWSVVSTTSLQLRAERAGLGTGRIYTVWVTATDSGGGSTTEPVTVRVD